MATLETQQIDAVIGSTRRRMLALGGTALAGLALAGIRNANAATFTDNDILNFALSLEFLGANYYSLGLNGVTIDKASTPIPTGPGASMTGGGTVTTKANFTAVPFVSTLVKNFVTQLLADEIAHVTTLQAALGTNAVAMANIDFLNSFNTLAAAAGIASFDPFANDANFLLGAFIFEDTDTSAYHGAAPLISDKVNVLPAAVAIHAVEAQHAGLIRTVLAQLDAAANSTVLSVATQKIAALRATLSTVGDVGVSAQTVTLEGSGSYAAATLVDADQNSLGWARTTNEILNVVTGGNLGGSVSGGANYTGGFFPNGINGTIQ